MSPEMGIGKVVTVRVMTTTQRDALEAVEGMVIFNSTTDQLEEYDGSTWQAVGQVIMDTHEADIDIHMADWLQKVRTAEYYSPYLPNNNSLLLTADTMYALPFIVARAMTLDRLVIQVTTGAAGKSARLGIYNDGTNLYPGTLVVDGGELSVADTGIVTVTIDQALTKGLYWLALASEGAPTVKGMIGSSVGNTLAILGTRSTALMTYSTGWRVSHTYAALPDPFTTGGSINDDEATPHIFVRLSSLD